MHKDGRWRGYFAFTSYDNVSHTVTHKLHPILRCLCLQDMEDEQHVLKPWVDMYQQTKKHSNASAVQSTVEVGDHQEEAWYTQRI